MKKLFFACAAFVALCMTGCEEKQKAPDMSAINQKDSLERIIAQKDNEINDIMGVINEVQEGFRIISEAENRVNIVKDGEGTNKAQQIRDNIKFISNTMKKNRELISSLRTKLKASGIKSEQLQATIDAMTEQIAENDKQLQQLRAELDSKDIHISELDETINNLNTDVSNLSTESQQKTATINTQDKQLHTAWYVFGTKSELKEQRIIVNGKVLQSNFNKSYFTKIDIRNVKEIKLYSKSAQMLTAHPSSSYTLDRDANKQYTLHITNPDVFWSTSKYLVVQVK